MSRPSHCEWACQCHCCETHRYDRENTRHLWSADEMDD